MKNKKTIIVIIAIFLAIVLIVGLVLGIDEIKNLFSQAAGQQQPQGTRVTNITANSATIVWQTAVPVIGQIEYGTTPGSFLLRAAETNQAANHNLTLSPLLPETIYYFRVRIDNQAYDNNGAPYSFTTKAIAETVSPMPTIIPPQDQNVQSPTQEPEETTVSPSPTPSQSSTEEKYILGDFVEKFGTSDPEFDLNNDGVVNGQDWFLYQKQNP